MSILSALPVIGGIIGGPLEKVIDKLGEDDRREFERAMAMLDNEYQVQLAQIKANSEASNHSSMFVAGARPAILWICAIGIAGIAAGHIAAIFNIPFTDINFEAMKEGEGFILGLAIPLLGIGTMRTVEKIKGVARRSVKGG